MEFGVPFDVAFSAEAEWRLAALVVFGQMKGGDWSWEDMRWLEKNS